MRFVVSCIALLMTLGLIIAGGAMVWGYQTYQEQGPLTETAIVTLEKGLGVNAIADRLDNNHVIDHPLLFRIIARITGDQTRLQAGEYEFTPGISIAHVFDKLTTGDVLQRQITIPEGLTSWQVVELLSNSKDFTGPPVTAIPPEGHLLPESYHITAGITRQDLLDRMQNALEQTLDELWKTRAQDLPLKTKAEALILASIVEKETALPAERHRVAGVFVNRLKRGIALQTDPTVIYALTNGEIPDTGMGPLGRRLLRKDLEIDSPYNTYRYPGLPPGPIANPGRAAIEATLNPEKHDFIYFVADGTGGHAFAKTLDEHNRNVAHWRKVRKNGK